jgi:hypothetical protein
MFEKVNTPTKAVLWAMLLGAMLYGNLMGLYQDYIGQAGWVHMVETKWVDSRITAPLHGLFVVYIVWAARNLIRRGNGK